MDKTSKRFVLVSAALAIYILAMLTTTASNFFYLALTLGLVGISVTPILISNIEA
jgi:hypothetical protein